MNCYYSNLIEGHHTLPYEIDQALSGNYSHDPKKSDRQREAVAHIEVQKLIDAGEAPSPIVSEDFVRWVHREFCQRLPDEMLWATNPVTLAKSRVVPGEFRTEPVIVGGHVPPRGDELGEHMARFVSAYRSTFGGLKQPIAAAAAHHRLVWIHPFLDGNGRVARLFTDAMLFEAGVGNGLWCVSRGFARTVEDYVAGLRAADERRQGDLDGRGNLSERGLEGFCHYFLDTCLDQVRFMRALMKPDELAARVKLWALEEVEVGRLQSGAAYLLLDILGAGSMRRGEVGEASGVGARQGRNHLRELTRRGLVKSDTPYGNVRLAFPVEVLERWLPNLYPPQALLGAV